MKDAFLDAMTTTSDDTGNSEDEILSMASAREGTNLLTSNGKDKEESAPPYPKSVFFIIGNEFCERFSYYGMRTILVIYLTHHLSFSENFATAIFHGFIMLCYFMPLFGAMLADGWLGKYRTILYLSLVYCIGNAVVSLTAFPPPEQVGPLLGLLLIGIGTGGIKPCVAAFGGDQFGAGQEKQQMQFFSVFYFAINAGSLISTLLTPILREDIRCFGENCYPIAFGIPAVLMVIALVLFVCGRNWYKRCPPTGNVIAQMFGCIGRALSNKCKSSEKKSHWLDYADDKYETPFIEDVRSVLRVLFLFLPLPIFWALFDQQGSRWTLQAVKMNGSLGALGKLYPDQMQAINPICIICLIPLFESVIYPLLNKCKLLNRPLQRMVVGMVLAAASFIMAGFLQLHIQATTFKPLETGETGVRFINAADCPIHLHSSFLNTSIPVLHDTAMTKLAAGGRYSAIYNCNGHPDVVGAAQINVTDGHGYYVVISRQQGQLLHTRAAHYTKKAAGGRSLIRVISVLSPDQSNVTVTMREQSGSTSYAFSVVSRVPGNFSLIDPGVYDMYVQSDSTNEVKLRDHVTTDHGGVYTVVVQQNISDLAGFEAVVYIDVPANTVSMLWQIPQYVVITVGEILFSISGLSFAYSQAPVSMKSILQAAWQMTTAFGSLIVVIIASGQWITDQAIEFFTFAGLMGVTTLIFIVMTVFYTYVDHQREYELPEQKDTAGLVDNMKDPVDVFSADDESGI